MTHVDIPTTREQLEALQAEGHFLNLRRPEHPDVVDETGLDDPFHALVRSLGQTFNTGGPIPKARSADGYTLDEEGYLYS